MILRFFALAPFVACSGADDPTDTTDPTVTDPTDDVTDATTDPTDPTTDVPPQQTQQGVTNTLSAALFSVTGTSASDVWAVGARDGDGPHLLHFDGAAWNRASLPGIGFDFWWVWHDGDDGLVIGGSEGQILNYEISTGAVVANLVADPAYTFFGVWGSAPDDVWAVAGDPSLGLPGAIYHYDGATWTLSAVAPAKDSTNRSAFKVWGRGANDVYIVGSGTLTMHWNGTSWSEITSPLFSTIQITTVTGDATEVIAVGGFGNAAAQTMTPTTATDISPPPSALAPAFLGVYDDDAHDPVASTQNGTLWWWRAGVWTVDDATPAYADALHGVWQDPDGGVWAVGGDLISQNRGTIVYLGDTLVPSP